MYKAQANPGAYAAAALVAGVSAAQPQCKKIIAQHKERQTSYIEYLMAQEARKELLLYGISNNA
jgi:hypothetical protein